MKKDFNYSKDKKGWVKYKVKKPKEKLRTYIKNLATHLDSINHKGFSYNRNKLIEMYNTDGIPGVHRTAKILVEDAIMKVKQ
jgi:hypothetical protein